MYNEHEKMYCYCFYPEDWKKDNDCENNYLDNNTSSYDYDCKENEYFYKNYKKCDCDDYNKNYSDDYYCNKNYDNKNNYSNSKKCNYENNINCHNKMQNNRNNKCCFCKLFRICK